VEKKSVEFAKSNPDTILSQQVPEIYILMTQTNATKIIGLDISAECLR
jgi:hypothetical protein